MFALGAMHGGGHDIPQDRAAALLWYRQGAEQGHPMATLMLGRYLAAGIACAPDPAAAKQCFARALEAGLAEARDELDALPQPAEAAE
jgi:TPR repeat protein